MTPTTQISLDFKAPNFSLPDGNDEIYHLNDLKGKKGTVVMFICNHCPFVIHVAEELTRLANDYKNQGFGFIAINSNDVEVAIIAESVVNYYKLSVSSDYKKIKSIIGTSKYVGYVTHLCTFTQLQCKSNTSCTFVSRLLFEPAVEHMLVL